MLIGLDAISLTEQKAGVGHYTAELARALAAAAPADDFELVYPAHAALHAQLVEDASDAPPNLRAAPVRAGLFARRKWSLGLSVYSRRRRPDLFHGTNYVLPLRCACPTVLTVHDLSAFLHPATHTPRVARALRRRLPVMARAADAVITPTEAVRREACELLRLDPVKVFAVPEAPRAVFRPLARAEALAAARRLGVTDNFILAVGTVEPRKNLPTLLRAFELLIEANFGDAATKTTQAMEATGSENAATGATRSLPGDVQLVIAGKVGWLADEFLARVSASDARGRVRFAGYVSDEDLRALYSSCLAFVYPSLYEGFGLPPLEAMACGAPVVASRVAALDETLGREAALAFNPTDSRELAALLAQLLADAPLCARLTEAGRRRAARFTWERAAGLTRDVYLRALERRQSRA